MPMGFEVVDGYLLGEPVSKPAVVEALLAQRSHDPAALPFYRALEAVGPRAADEAFIALRAVLAGLAPSDERVRRLRALAAVARACATGDRPGALRVFKRDAAVLTDLAPPASDAGLHATGVEARAAYARELTSAP